MKNNEVFPPIWQQLALKLEVLSSNGPSEFKATVQMEVDDLLKGYTKLENLFIICSAIIIIIIIIILINFCELQNEKEKTRHKIFNYK